MLLEIPGCRVLTAPRIIAETAAPGCFSSDARLARTAGVAPIPASSGARHRHRLDRGCNRKLNAAVHRIAILQGRTDPEARAYLACKQAEGTSHRDAVRCPKRFVVRRVRHLLPKAPTSAGALNSAIASEVLALTTARPTSLGPPEQPLRGTVSGGVLRSAFARRPPRLPSLQGSGRRTSDRIGPDPQADVPRGGVVRSVRYGSIADLTGTAPLVYGCSKANRYRGRCSRRRGQVGLGRRHLRTVAVDSKSAALIERLELPHDWRLMRAAVAPAGVIHAGGDLYPLGLVGLPSLMAVTSGRAEIVIGLIDGPVAVDHPDLAAARIRAVAGSVGACTLANPSCTHGTFVAGVLAARRGTEVPAICPGCTVLVRPIFVEPAPGSSAMPTATATELAQAILECIDGGARLLNISAALTHADAQGERQLTEALDLASRRGVLVVVAAGNHGVVGSSVITRHRWVVPVVAYARSGRPLAGSNLGRSIGRNGVGAPGEGVASLTPAGGTVRLSGTSAAAPFVTGAAALLWSQFPTAPAASVRLALTRPVSRPRQATPPLMNAWAAYQTMTSWHQGR